MAVYRQRRQERRKTPLENAVVPERVLACNGEGNSPLERRFPGSQHSWAAFAYRRPQSGGDSRTPDLLGKAVPLVRVEVGEPRKGSDLQYHTPEEAHQSDGQSIESD